MQSVNQRCLASKVAAACPTGLCHLGSPEEQLEKKMTSDFYNTCTGGKKVQWLSDARVAGSRIEETIKVVSTASLPLSALYTYKYNATNDSVTFNANICERCIR